MQVSLDAMRYMGAWAGQVLRLMKLEARSAK